jgi:DNA-binding NtrC family response regulator
MSDVKKPALYVGLCGDAPRTPPARISLAGADRVDIGRAETRRVERRTEEGAQVVALSLADLRMSTRHARMTRAEAAWVLEDLDSKNGTVMAHERIKKRALTDGDAFVVGHTVLVFRADTGDDTDVDGVPAAPAPALQTVSPLLTARFRELADAVLTSAPIEVTGEPRSGKAGLAHAVHAISGRTGEIVTIACAAASKDDLAAVNDAAGGTLLLDEVADLPEATQTALLALVRGTDLRIVSTTSRDLDREVEAGRFSADLRAALRGHAVALPPLRRRREDLGGLIGDALSRIAPNRAITFTPDAAGELYQHDWPLNIRELELSLRAAVAAAQDGRVELAHMPVAVGSTEPLEDQTRFRAMTAEEKQLRDKILLAITRHQGNLAAVAKELGKDPGLILRLMKQFGIPG